MNTQWHIHTVALVLTVASGWAADDRAVGAVKPIAPAATQISLETIDKIEPLTNTYGNRALFVGIAKFDHGLPGLRYTPDDAVAMAYEFCLRLKLFRPDCTRLALAGDPQSVESREKLARLKTAGIKTIIPKLVDLVTSIEETADEAEPNALLLMSFSTHGFEASGQAFVMPRDGRRSLVRATGISLQTINEVMQRSKANKRLLIVDACRESPEVQTRGSEAMPTEFYRAVSASEGMATISSCGAGELSWEHEGFQQGVFTHYFIRALGGEAKAQPDSGLILLEAVYKYAREQTMDWVKSNKGRNQEPFSNAGRALDIPLAYSRYDREAAAKIRQRVLNARGVLFDIWFANNSPLSEDGLFERFNAALKELAGDKLQTFLEHVEAVDTAHPAKVRAFVSYWKKNLPAAASLK